MAQPRHRPFPELIEAIGGRWLCEPDDPEALAAAIEELLRDPEPAWAIGARERETVRERFHVAQIAKNMPCVFEQVVRSRDALRV